MQNAQHDFPAQFLRVVLAALVPVILVAFTSIPFNLGGHPGEARDHARIQMHAVG